MPYQKKLERQIQGQWVFQEDNARFHTTTAPTKLKEDLEVDRMDWPQYSLDVAPIENLWGIVNSKLDKEKINTLKELKAKVTKIWKGLKVDLAQNLYESMNNRCMELIMNEGHKIDY